MKRITYLLFIGFAILQSCSKKKSDTPKPSGLSQAIQNFVPESIIDSMRKWGFVINEGKKPPMINGVYNVSPNLCTFDNSGSNESGYHFDNYHYKFHNQNNDKLTIALDEKNTSGSSGIDSASGIGSFISGTSNDFTVFTDEKGVSYGINYESITIISGTITSTGIENFQNSFYMKDKGNDPDKKLIDVGSARIFKDEDSFSEKIPDDNYRIAVLKDNNLQRAALSVGKAFPER